MPDEPIEVRDRRTVPRHAVIFADDWDSPRFRLLSPTQRNVYVTLALYATGGRGDVWPRQATIAAVVRATLRAVQYAIRKLVALGYIEVTRQPTGPKRGNIYTLLSPPREAP